jgi:hypothetical protein
MRKTKSTFFVSYSFRKDGDSGFGQMVVEFDEKKKINSDFLLELTASILKHAKVEKAIILFFREIE